MNNRDFYPLLVVGILFLLSVITFTYLNSVFFPLFVALLLAFLFDPLVAPFERLGVQRAVAITLVFLLILVAGAGLGTLFVSSLSSEFSSVKINLPEYAGRIYEVIPAPVKVYLDIETPAKVYGHINQALDSLRGASVDIIRETFLVVRKAFSSTLAFILVLLGYCIIPVYLYYFMKDLPLLKERTLSFIPDRYRNRVAEGAREIHDILAAFVRGQLVVCAILAILYSAGLLVIGIDLALLIGTTAGLAFIIPYFGTILGIVFSMLMAALKFHDFLHPLLCLGWIAIVQGLEGTVITPRIVGDKVGLHPVVVIVALMIGGEVAGIFGMLLAVPVTAVLNVFFRVLLESYRKSAFFEGS
jgi:predicted PurR-regulated permease PerM